LVVGVKRWLLKLAVLSRYDPQFSWIFSSFATNLPLTVCSLPPFSSMSQTDPGKAIEQLSGAFNESRARVQSLEDTLVLEVHWQIESQ
jgi:hypothetical protein